MKVEDMKRALGRLKRRWYLWNLGRFLKDRENRKVAMLLYDHLGIRLGRLRKKMKHFDMSYNILEIYLEKRNAGALCVFTDSADEPFRCLGWERLWKSQMCNGVDFEPRLGIPQFSSAKELKMKLELRGCMG